MSVSAIRHISPAELVDWTIDGADADDDDRTLAEPFLPAQLARAAEATGRLIGQGLIDRGLSGFALTDETGVLNPEIAPLAYAYEAALLSGLSPQEVRSLRRLLTKVEAAALKLSGRQG